MRSLVRSPPSVTGMASFNRASASLAAAGMSSHLPADTSAQTARPLLCLYGRTILRSTACLSGHGTRSPSPSVPS